jgi:hypothetical protein
MELILKRGTEYTPVIFQHPDLQNKRYYKITTYLGRKDIPIEDIMKFPLEVERLGLENIRANRLAVEINYFYGGIFETEDLIALLAYKDNNPEDKYVIAREGFFITYPTYLTRLKKYMNDSNISSRTKLLLWPQSRIYSEFQELITPGMNDYNPEIQKALSNEFILYQRSLIPVKVTVERGDYVMILTSTYNSNNINLIGKVVQVRYTDSELFDTESRTDRESYYNNNLIFKRTDARLATQEEINNFLSYQPVINSTYQIGDYVCILSSGSSITEVPGVGIRDNNRRNTIVQIEGITPLGGSATSLDPRYYGSDWNVRGEDLRRATEEEIDDYLGI